MYARPVHRTRRPALAGLVALLVLAACGAPAATPSPAAETAVVIDVTGPAPTDPPAPTVPVETAVVIDVTGPAPATEPAPATAAPAGGFVQDGAALNRDPAQAAQSPGLAFGSAQSGTDPHLWA